MDFKDVKIKTDEELVKLLEHSQEELRALRFKTSTSSLKQNNKISLTRKIIARIQTEFKLRNLNK
ncbi:MAG: 50S ribosomal protein L29 [Candidatus Magasanikbacteria bacterium]|nr:50S ribosomal protein L29 [Candidatus Magasanikbacteria bacterium]